MSPINVIRGIHIGPISDEACNHLQVEAKFQNGTKVLYSLIIHSTNGERYYCELTASWSIPAAKCRAVRPNMSV